MGNIITTRLPGLPLRAGMLLLLLVLAPVEAQALNKNTLLINGVALYRDLGTDVFVGALKLEQKTRNINTIESPETAKIIEIRFLDTMSSRRWRNYWTQSIAINNDYQALEASADALSRILSQFQGNLGQGDIVELIYDPQTGTEVRVNNQLLDTQLPGAVFQLFLSALIGPVPPSSQFKQAILGMEDSTSEWERFDQLSPRPERLEIASQWRAAFKQPATEETVADSPSEEPAEPVTPAPQTAAETASSANSADFEILPEAPTRQQVRIDTELPAANLETTAIGTDEIAGKFDTVALAPAVLLPDEEPIKAVSASDILAEQDYISGVVRQIYSQVRYPKIAVKRGYQGSVRAVLTVDRNGGVNTLVIADESPYSALNKEVARAINSAAPFPQIPETIASDSLEILVPVSFQLSH